MRSTLRRRAPARPPAPDRAASAPTRCATGPGDRPRGGASGARCSKWVGRSARFGSPGSLRRSEEHTSELQSQSNLVCRLLLEKKKKNDNTGYSLTTGYVA